MKFFTAVSAALLLLVPVIAAPPAALKTVRASGGESLPDSYIVKLKDGVSKDAHLRWLSSNHGSDAVITHPQWSSRVLHGYAGTLHTDALNALRASDDVEYIEEDAIAHHSAVVTQIDAPWGLQRISQDERLPDGSDPSLLVYNYTYEESAGSGVDIYILDTGIRTTHNEFGGRARWGPTFTGTPDEDIYGHGTHCAGTAGGSRVGVAKKASLIAVKVLGDDGSGPWSSIISGLDYVVTEFIRTGVPSIASMSLSGLASDAMDSAVEAATNAGIHVVCSAGNTGQPSDTRSPARAPSAITVAASDIQDQFASFSSYGSAVDIIAPGVYVFSASNTNDAEYRPASGTSMSTPHVAGLLATLVSDVGNFLPVEAKVKLTQLATKDAITGVPPDTVNYLARNQV
nr:subtilisin-like serine protease precursor [Lignosus rhinocerotis]